MFLKKVPKIFLITLTLLIFSSLSCFSQWKTAVSNNIVDDITITYEVLYERQLTSDEKKSTQYVSKITTTFDKNHMIERRFGNKPQVIEHYSLFNYKTLKGYYCSVFGNTKKAIQYEFNDPVVPVDTLNVESKIILGYPSKKGLVVTNKIPKEIYYTKNIGLRYCLRFKIDGFLLT